MLHRISLDQLSLDVQIGIKLLERRAFARARSGLVAALVLKIAQVNICVVQGEAFNVAERHVRYSDAAPFRALFNVAVLELQIPQEGAQVDIIRLLGAVGFLLSLY